MDQKKLLTIIGLSILILYFIATAIWISNFQTDIKIQNVRQLSFI